MPDRCLGFFFQIVDALPTSPSPILQRTTLFSSLVNCRLLFSIQPHIHHISPLNPNLSDYINFLEAHSCAMCLIFTCGEHTFRKEVEGYEGIICRCYNCGNQSGRVIKSHPWFTFCFIVSLTTAASVSPRHR